MAREGHESCLSFVELRTALADRLTAIQLNAAFVYQKSYENKINDPFAAEALASSLEACEMFRVMFQGGTFYEANEGNKGILFRELDPEKTSQPVNKQEDAEALEMLSVLFQGEHFSEVKE